MSTKEIKITPQDSLVAAVASIPKKRTIILAKGTYVLKECLIIDKTVTLRGETGDPQDVVISRTAATVLMVANGKPRFEAITFQAPRPIVDIQPHGGAGFMREPIEYKSAVAIRDKGVAQFVNCVATSDEQSGFSVRGKKARITLSHCLIKNTGEGGIFFDDQGRGEIEDSIIEQSGLGCVDVEEKGFVCVKNTKLLSSSYSAISLHNCGRAKFVDCEICGASTRCAIITEKSELVAVRTSFYSHVSKDQQGSPDFSADGILVSDSRVKFVETRHYATRFGIGAEDRAIILLKNVTMEYVFATVIGQSSVKLIERGKNSLCEPPKLGGALDERGSRITPEGIVDDDEPDSLEIMTREKKEYTQDEIDAAFLVKDVFLRQELNEPWPRVLHAPIPFDGGGMLDGYYYPNSKYGGTIMVSKEIATPGFNSPNNFTFCSYELAIATQTPFPYDNDGNVVRPESVKKYQRLHKLLSDVGHYVENTSHFNRYDSIGLAPDHGDPDLRNAAFVADAVCLSNTLAQDAPMVRLEKLSAAARMEYEEIYPGLLEKLAKRRVPTSFFEDRQFFGVMIIIEVYQSELQAMLRKELTREEFIGRLKEAGYWPFSDLDLRPPLL